MDSNKLVLDKESNGSFPKWCQLVIKFSLIWLNKFNILNFVSIAFVKKDCWSLEGSLVIPQSIHLIQNGFWKENLS